MTGQSPAGPLAAGELSKTFGSTRALDHAQLDLYAGEVHGLIGANGSGKSTLIRILAGAERADPGSRLEVHGVVQDLDTWDLAHSRAAGMRFVHQEPCLFPMLSVAENMAADGPLARGWLRLIRRRSLGRSCREQLRHFELDVEPHTPLQRLRPADRAMVAILRALRDIGAKDGGGFLVLDEPTASLPRHEVELLLASIRRVASSGHAVLYVSHRLDEILAVTQRVTVIRDGRNVDTIPTAQLDESRLVELITGRRSTAGDTAPPTRDAGPPLLDVRALNSTRLRDVTFEVRAGEVVGIVGMLGSGRTELLRTLFGDRPAQSGEIRLGGAPLRLRSPSDAVAAGLAYVPEDRGAEAAFMSLDVDANLAAAVLHEYWYGGRLRHRRRRRDSAGLLGTYRIVANSVGQPLSTLSGGNQQKVVLARWLRRSPRVLLLDEPTQGVDVGAREEIYRLVRQATAAGAAALVALSDLEELIRVVDRALVMRDGALIAVVHKEQLTVDHLNAVLYSGKPEAA